MNIDIGLKLKELRILDVYKRQVLSLPPAMCAGAELEKQISECPPEIPADFFQK